MIKYPARWEQEETFLFCRFIDFPDIAFTQGANQKELLDNAQHVLSMALKHYLDHGLDIPGPSEIQGDDIIRVAPYAKIRQRLGHGRKCDCPVCRSSRGERKRTKERFEVWINRALKARVKEYARKERLSEGEITEKALERFLA
jgi:predicted RNase H-like HicB family nuclease